MNKHNGHEIVLRYTGVWEQGAEVKDGHFKPCYDYPPNIIHIRDEYLWCNDCGYAVVEDEVL